MTTTVSLPEYTEEYKQQQHQQVLEAEVVHEWECVLRTKVKLFGTLIVGGAGIIFVGVMNYLHPNDLLLLLCGGGVLMFFPVCYFLFYPDYDYKGQITPKGIIIQKTERVPEIFYKATRGMAYIGIVVCVIAALMVGPLAFVGAGAFALLSFKMTGFHKQTEIDIHPFHQNNSYQVLISRLDDMYQWDIYTFLCDVPDFIDTDYYDLHIMSFECKASDFANIESVLKKYVSFID